MFKDNKYTNWYYRIIKIANNRVNDGYVESHHIIPKCLGGSDKKNNLVELTAREHFICHLLLTKMTDEPKLKFAFYMMTVFNQNHIDKRYTPKSSRLYEYAKLCNSIASKYRMVNFQGHNTGKKRYTNKITGEVKFLFDTEVDENWVHGWDKSFRDNMSRKQKGRTYHYNPDTLEVKSFLPDDTVPNGWIKGNPNANTSDNSNIKGSSYYHNPNTGEYGRFHNDEIPTGWEKGSCERWITDGINNKRINYITDAIPDGWTFGKTIPKGNKTRKYVPVVTPIGAFNHPLDFCDKYKVDKSFFDSFDNAIRIRKSNQKLVDELKLVGYDFSKTKAENGFKFKEES